MSILQNLKIAQTLFDWADHFKEQECDLIVNAFEIFAHAAAEGTSRPIDEPSRSLLGTKI